VVERQLERIAADPIRDSDDGGLRRPTQVLHALVSEQSVDAILSRIASDLRALVPCDDVVIWELCGDTLRVILVDGDDEPEMRRLRIAVGEGITGEAVRRQETLVSANAQLDPRAARYPATGSPIPARKCNT
jgi:signal transduction protein with GAF and PtsI domain